jgi:hypothetical protein
MALLLQDIRDFRTGLSCTPTMICAISSLTPEEAGLLLQKAAQQCGVEISPELRKDYDLNHWLNAVKLLGGRWEEADNLEDWPFEARPQIDEWMRVAALKNALQLVFCDDGNNQGHTFATFNGDVVDTYTGGKRTKFNGVPGDYEMFRVKRSFIVRER